MNWAVVMTGGKGTRFWPESRRKHPKPFLKLLGRRTLLEETIHRLGPYFPPSRILIVLADFLIPQARRLFPRIPKENFLGEPVGRNTAPCCVYAAAQIARRDPAAKVVFLPADQHIRPKSLYLKTLKTAFEIVDEKPVLLGMRPDSPHTGYGYLEVDRKRRVKGLVAFRVKRFREKPGLREARRFLRQGNFLWNGGTFIWRLDAFKEAVRRYAPKIYGAWDKLVPSALRKIYPRLPSISLDYAVMEKMKNVHALLAPFEWKDLGGWAGVAEFWPSDKKGNRIFLKKGTVPFLFIRSERNIVKSNERLVALVGVQDLVVVDTEDALLISPRREAERIRDIVRELEKRKAFQYL